MTSGDTPKHNSVPFWNIIRTSWTPDEFEGLRRIADIAWSTLTVGEVLDQYSHLSPYDWGLDVSWED